MYNQNLIKDLKKKIRNETILIVLVMLILSSVTTLGFVFMNKGNMLLWEIVISLVDVICLFVIIYISSVFLHKNRMYVKHIQFVIKSSGVSLKGIILSISDYKDTINPGVVCHEITINVDGVDKKYYLLDLIDTKLIKLDIPVKLEIVSTFVKDVKYENSAI